MAASLYFYEGFKLNLAKGDIQLDTELFRYPERIVAFDLVFVFLADSVCVSFDAKTGKKIDAFNMNTLLLDEPGSQ